MGHRRGRLQGQVYRRQGRQHPKSSSVLPKSCCLHCPPPHQRPPQALMVSCLLRCHCFQTGSLIPFQSPFQRLRCRVLTLPQSLALSPPACRTETQLRCSALGFSQLPTPASPATPSPTCADTALGARRSQGLLLISHLYTFACLLLLATVLSPGLRESLHFLKILLRGHLLQEDSPDLSGCIRPLPPRVHGISVLHSRGFSRVFAGSRGHWRQGPKEKFSLNTREKGNAVTLRARVVRVPREQCCRDR